MTTRSITTVLLSCLALAAGCVSSGGDDLGRHVAALAGDHASVPEAEWLRAPAGCTGRLGDVSHFAPAASAEGIVVGVNRNGISVCADGVEAIETELDEMGAPPDALQIVVERLDAMRTSEAFGYARDDRTRGDPSPQPSSPRRAAALPSITPGGGINLGDPSPQPSSPRRDTASEETSDGPTDGDPSPQPSSPRNTTSATSAPTSADPSPQPSQPVAPEGSGGATDPAVTSPV